MKLKVITESIHTVIFVDFDETIGHIGPIVDTNLETIELTPVRMLTMRNKWKEFLHALDSLEHSGKIHIFSGGGGQLSYPFLIEKYKDLASFVDILTPETVLRNVHNHSILIDDDPMAVLTDAKFRVLGLTRNNLVKVKPFKGEMDNELNSVFKEARAKIAELEKSYP